MGFYVTTIFLIVSFTFSAHCYIAYQCNENHLNKTTISLVQTPECRETAKNLSTTSIEIVVTQPTTLKPLVANRCLVTIQNIIFRCGKSIDTHSPAGFYTEVPRLSESECNTLIKHGEYKYGSLVIQMSGNDLRTSATTWGHIDSDSSCTHGGDLNINGHNYQRPVRNSDIHIRATTLNLKVDVEENKAILPNGVQCNYLDEHCFDGDYGYVFWKIHTPECGGQSTPEYSVVYKGFAEKVIDNDVSPPRIYYHVSQEGIEFQILAVPKVIHICGYMAFYTEHPNLFITENLGYVNFKLDRQVNKYEVNLMTYFNSKLIHAMRHTRDQVDKLFQLFSIERCKTENRIIQNMMTTAILSPNEFAFQYFASAGYIALNRGEVIHIIQCDPVVVRLQPQTEECFNELQVTLNNETYFMLPRSRILTKIGTPIECTSAFGPEYFLEGKWIKSTPHGFIQIDQPEIISPTSINYKFEELKSLAIGGLYSNEAMKSMHKAILNPIEQPAIISGIIRAVTGSGQMNKGYLLTNGFTQLDFERVEEKLESWWNKFLRGISILGNISSVIIGIIIMVRIIVGILNSVINFRVLKRDFGWFTALCCFWWDSMAHNLTSNHIKSNWFQRRDEEAGIQEQPGLYRSFKLFQKRSQDSPSAPDVYVPVVPTTSDPPFFYISIERGSKKGLLSPYFWRLSFCWRLIWMFSAREN